MPSAPADSRDETPEHVEDESRGQTAAITSVSPEPYPSEDPVFRGTFPLTYRAGEWYI